MTDQAGTLPADADPEEGAVYHYGGDNYLVTRVDRGSFLTMGHDSQWCDAIEFTDLVGDDETATITYVMGVDQFGAYYEPGEIVEGEGPPVVDNELPPEAGTKPVEPDEPEPEPKG